MAFVNTSTYSPKLGRGRIAASRRERFAASQLQTYGADDDDSSDEDIPSKLGKKFSTFRSDTLPSARAAKYFYGAHSQAPQGSYAQFKEKIQQGRTLSQAKDDVAPERGSVRRVDPTRVSTSFRPGDFSGDKTCELDMKDKRRREDDSEIAHRVAEKFGTTSRRNASHARHGFTRAQRRELPARDRESVYNTKRIHLHWQRGRERAIDDALRARAEGGPPENFVQSARAKLQATEHKVQKALVKAEARRGASSARSGTRGGIGMQRMDRGQRDRARAARRVTARGGGAVRAEVVEEAARHTARWGMMEEAEVSGLRDRLAASGVLTRGDADEARRMPQSAHTGVFSLREAAGRHEDRSRRLAGGLQGGGLRGGGAGASKVFTLTDMELQREKRRVARKELSERQLTSGMPMRGGTAAGNGTGRVIHPRAGGVRGGDFALDSARAAVADDVQQRKRRLHRQHDMQMKLFEAEKGKAGTGVTTLFPGFRMR